jgi:hypothetical protein
VASKGQDQEAWVSVRRDSSHVRTRGSTTTREARVRGVRQARHAARSIVTDLLELTAEVASHTNLQGASARI